MPRERRTPVAQYRDRKRSLGVVRVEVMVKRDDVQLLRNIARALSDPAQEGDTRLLLQERFGDKTAPGLKALLVAAPLDDLDLTRSADTGRPVSL